MAFTIKDAEKLKATERAIVDMFGNDNRYYISLDDRGHISAHLKEEFRNKK
ncbi:hypothetical protein [Sphingobacterium detergens]|uniref:hypothetical protein n=1 Tax=Sphingobacterium detergens TaxID=1145106 RepID=UPI003AAB2479